MNVEMKFDYYGSSDNMTLEIKLGENFQDVGCFIFEDLNSEEQKRLLSFVEDASNQKRTIFERENDLFEHLEYCAGMLTLGVDGFYVKILVNEDFFEDMCDLGEYLMKNDEERNLIIKNKFFEKERQIIYNRDPAAKLNIFEEEMNKELERRWSSYYKNSDRLCNCSLF